MALPLLGFTDYVRMQAAAVQGAVTAALDLTIGSALRAILEANAAVALWLQWLAAQVLATTRAATSQGADLDSWMADFGVVRLPASQAAGQVMLSRYAPTLAAVVLPGAQVRASATGQVYTVQADPTNAAWAGAGYQIAAGIASVSVPVVAVTAGSIGNASIGTVDQVASALPGVDQVTNAIPIAGGLDAESDASLRLRFGNFLDSRTRATTTAVSYAIASLRQGLRWVIADGQDALGNAAPARFTVTLDDGTGQPSPDLLTAASAAIDAVRPVGTSFTVRGPVVLPVTVQVSLTLSLSGQSAGVAALVASAIQTYATSLGIGAALPVSRVVALAFGASSAVQAAAVLLNGTAADAVPLPWGVVQIAGIAVA
jgi:uncharacterized phage protein gp47/JayE